MDDGSGGWDRGEGPRDESNGSSQQGGGDLPIPAPSPVSDNSGTPELPDPVLEERKTPEDARADEVGMQREGKPSAGHADPTSPLPPAAQDAGSEAQQGTSRQLPAEPTRAQPEQPSRSPSTRAPRSRPDRHRDDGTDQIDASLFLAHSLSNFLSTSRIPRQLDTLVADCLQRDTRLEHVLIHGAIGSGTKLLARALINDYAPRRVVEIDATLGCDAELLRRSIDEVGPRGVLFIRHIDALEGECDQMLAEALSGRPSRTRRPRGFVDPSESDLDRAISASASPLDQPSDAKARDFTLIATAHMMTQVGYIVRTRIEHLFHLRDDPKALRNAVLRALRRHGSVTVSAAALPQLERVLKSLVDSAEPVTRAALLRASSEGTQFLDETMMRSILEEDLAARLPDEAYSSSLRRHLAGRKIDQVTPEEVARLAAETGWGGVAAEAALSMMLREESRRRPA